MAIPPFGAAPAFPLHRDANFNNFKGTLAADPVSAQDLVNLRTLQAYVATLASKDICYYMTAAALPANVYSNGTLGVGATLTGVSFGALTVDGAAVIVGDPIAVNNEAIGSHNGLYIVTAVGALAAVYVLTRRTDYDQAAEIGPGQLVPVDAPSGRTAGATNDQSVFLSVAPSPFVVGTSTVNFVRFGITYSADGTSITLTGTTFSMTSVGTAGTYGDATHVPQFTTNAKGQVISVTPVAITASVQRTFPFFMG